MTVEHRNQDMPRAGLPVPVAQTERHAGESTARGSLYRYKLPSSFASQLLASKQNLMTQRRLRRAPVNVATHAYAACSSLKIKRMPAGFGLTIDA